MNTTDLDQLVERYVTLADQIATLTAQQDQVKAQLRALGPGQHETSLGAVVTVTPQRRFNAAKAAEALPEGLRAACMDFSATRAKKVLPPAAYEAFMDETGEHRVIVK